MNFLKTPQQKLMEEAGMMPASPGMLKTPQQALMEESGIQPKFFADGGSTTMSVQDMLAALIAAGQEPQKFAGGGLSTPANIGTQVAFNAPFLTPEILEMRKNIAAKKYGSAAENAAALGLAVAPLNPLTAILSLMEPIKLGDATLDTYRKQQAEEAARQQEIVRARARAQSPVFKHNQPVEMIDLQEQPSFPSLSKFYNR
jgi:hypothetical protein